MEHEESVEHEESGYARGAIFGEPRERRVLSGVDPERQRKGLALTYFMALFLRYICITLSGFRSVWYYSYMSNPAVIFVQRQILLCVNIALLLRFPHSRA